MKNHNKLPKMIFTTILTLTAVLTLTFAPMNSSSGAATQSSCPLVDFPLEVY